MRKTWHYAIAPGTRAGLMVCTVCRKPIESGQFRYHSTKEAHFPQHRACSESDPRWKYLDNHQLKQIADAKATLEDFRRIQDRGFWDVSEEIEELEAIVNRPV